MVSTMATTSSNRDVREVTTRQFRDNLFTLLREVRESGSEVVVTNRGKPYARVVREVINSGGIVGCDKGILRIVGDLSESGIPAEQFYSDSEPKRVIDGETDWC